MTAEPGFDVEQANRFFAVHCFNAVWELLDKSDRTAAENDQMVRLAHASLWHWTQRPDCTPRNLSIGYWQVSRVYAVLEQPENARRYGQRCLDATPEDLPFYLGFAHESLARAAAVAGDQRRLREHLDEARRLAQLIEDEEERSMLTKDLDELG